MRKLSFAFLLGFCVFGGFLPIFVIQANSQAKIPEVYLSSTKLEQGDTFLIKIKNEPPLEKITAKLNGKKIEFFESSSKKEWFALGGIGSKMKPGRYSLVINFPEDLKFKKTITVVKRNFPVTEFFLTQSLKEKGFTRSKAVQNLTQEGQIVDKIFQTLTAKVFFEESFINPLSSISVTDNFGNIRKSLKFTLRHFGTDLGAKNGEPVFAVNDGVVKFAKNLKASGNLLIIDHGLGIFSMYAHLGEFQTEEEKEIKRGEIIASVGSSGYSTGNHLHFAVKLNGVYVDPLRFIALSEKEIH